MINERERVKYLTFPCLKRKEHFEWKYGQRQECSISGCQSYQCACLLEPMNSPETERMTHVNDVHQTQQCYSEN